MIVYTDHANHMLSFTLVVHDQHVIIKRMKLEEMSVTKRRMLQHVIMPTGFLHLALLRKLADGLAHRTDDKRELIMRVFCLQRHGSTPKIRRSLHIPHSYCPTSSAVKPSSPSTSSGIVRASTASSGNNPYSWASTRSISRRTSSANSRLTPEENNPSNGVRLSLATCVTIIFIALGVVMPLRAKAASARCLTSSGTLI